MKILALLFSLTLPAQAILWVDPITINPDTLSLRTNFSASGFSAQSFNGEWQSGTFTLNCSVVESTQPCLVVSLSTSWDDGWDANVFYNVFFNFGSSRTYAAPASTPGDFYFHSPGAPYATEGVFLGSLNSQLDQQTEGEFTFTLSRVAPRPLPARPLPVPEGDSTLLLFSPVLLLLLWKKRETPHKTVQKC